MELPLDPQIFVFVGKPKAGKSVAVRAMQYEYAKAKHFKFGIGICRTAFAGNLDYLPPKAIWPEYDEKRLERYVEAMRARTAALKKEGKTMPPNFVILDDLLGTIDMYSKFFSNWIATFRWTNTSIFITAQRLGGRNTTSPLLRDCADYAFMYRTMTEDSRRALYDNFGGVFPARKAKNAKAMTSREVFYEALDEATDVESREFGCLVFHNNAEPNESYWRWKSPLPPEFHLKY